MKGDSESGQGHSASVPESSAGGLAVVGEGAGCFQIAIRELWRRPCGGTWVDGTIQGYRFQALVFAEHAKDPAWEIGRSQISKLWVQHIDSAEVVYNWDRGLDIPANGPDVRNIVEHLGIFLAPYVFKSGEKAAIEPQE